MNYILRIDSLHKIISNCFWNFEKFIEKNASTLNENYGKYILIHWAGDFFPINSTFKIFKITVKKGQKYKSIIRWHG